MYSIVSSVRTRATAAVLLFALLAALLLPSCNNSIPDLTKDGKLATSDGVDYFFYVPKTSWTVDTETGMISAYVTTADSKDISNISVCTFALQAGSSVTPDEYWNSDINTQTFTVFSDYTQVSSDTTVTLDGYAAAKYVYTATLAGSQYKYMFIVCIKNNLVYQITYTSVPAVTTSNSNNTTSVSQDFYDLHIDDVNNIISTFKFKDGSGPLATATGTQAVTPAASGTAAAATGA